MQYQVVFDLAQAGYHAWWTPAAGLFVVGWIAALLLSRRYPARWRLALPGSPETRLLLYACLGLAAFGTALLFAGTLREYLDLRRALVTGNVRVTEGRVEDFQAAPYGGGGDESFSVCGRPFSFSNSPVSAAYHHTASHGGAIKPGLRVRITHVGNQIVRLEIAGREDGRLSCSKGD